MGIAMAAGTFPAHHPNFMLRVQREGTQNVKSMPEAEYKMKQML
jgi:hypothetical protein